MPWSRSTRVSALVTSQHARPEWAIETTQRAMAVNTLRRKIEHEQIGLSVLGRSHKKLPGADDENELVTTTGLGGKLSRSATIPRAEHWDFSSSKRWR